MPTTIPTITSSDRASLTPSAGDAYFETDTKNYLIYDGANWRVYNSDDSVYNLSSTTLSVDFTNSGSASTNDFLNTDYQTASNTGFTFSAYVKSNTTINQLFIDNYTSASSGQLAFRVNGSGQYLLYYKITTGGTQTLFNTSSFSASDLLDDTWHHVALTMSGTSVKIYEDGSEKYTATLSSSYVAQATNFRIGANLGKTAVYDGLMDEVAFFERELTAAQILSQYTNQEYVSPDCHFRMGDGGSDTDSDGAATAGEAVVTINDISGNGHTATQSTAANKPAYSSETKTF
jgi:hypothetical protein